MPAPNNRAAGRMQAGDQLDFPRACENGQLFACVFAAWRMSSFVPNFLTKSFDANASALILGLDVGLVAVAHLVAVCTQIHFGLPQIILRVCNMVLQFFRVIAAIVWIGQCRHPFAAILRVKQE